MEENKIALVDYTDRMSYIETVLETIHFISKEMLNQYNYKYIKSIGVKRISEDYQKCRKILEGVYWGNNINQSMNRHVVKHIQKIVSVLQEINKKILTSENEDNTEAVFDTINSIEVISGAYDVQQTRIALVTKYDKEE